MLFNNEHYGNPISLKLSEYLRDWTDKDDRAAVAVETGVSMSTVRDVTYRNNNLTEENSKAIIKLMERAVKNCTNKIEYAKKAKKDLETQLQVA